MNVRKKILFVTGSMGAGGAERVISVLSNHFVTQSNQVEIVCYKGSDLFYELEDRVKVVFLDEFNNNPTSLSRLYCFRTYLKSSKPDIVIAFMAQLYFFSKIALIGKSIPIIAAERIDPRSTKLLFRVLRKILYPMASHLVFQTEHIRQYFSKYIQRKSTIIHNPISDKYIGCHHSLGASGAQNIVTIGRLTEQKNHYMLIRSFERVRALHSVGHLNIYGEGPLKEKLQSFINEKGLEDHVSLHGIVQNIPEVLKRATMFVLSSNYEGMSNALIEAMYVGLPVVSTRISGSTDLIESGVNGVLVDIGDEKQMASAMGRILTDSKFARELGEKASLISSKVDKEIIVTQWLKIIDYLA